MNKSFNEIMKMIIGACNSNFYHGAKDNTKTVIECATQIYIAQMQGAKMDGGEK